MKKLILPLITGLLFTGFPLNTYAQNITAHAKAQLVEALDIEEVNQLNFGTFIAGNTQTTVIIADDAAGTVSGTANHVGGETSSGAFYIQGAKNAYVNVTIPSSGSLKHVTTDDMLTISSFTVSNNRPQLHWNTADATVYVGATLTVPAAGEGLAKGEYSGTYTVTFAYE